MELEKFISSELAVSDEFRKKLIEFKTLEKEIGRFEEELKEKAKSYMEENNLKKLESDVLDISYIDSFVRKSIDNDRLKEEGLYELYTKETLVKPSIRLKFK